MDIKNLQGSLSSYSPEKLLLHSDKIKKILNDTPAYPITFTIDFTNVCNQNCDFCLNAKQRKTFCTEIPFEKIKDILELSVKLGIKGIKVAGGGEPLLHSRIIDIFNLMRNYDLDYALTTNGTAFTDETIKASKNLFKYINISCETFDADEYQKIRKVDLVKILQSNIKKLCSINDNPVNLGLLVHPYAYKRILRTVKIAKELGITDILIKPLAFNDDYSYSLGDIDFDILENNLNEAETLGAKISRNRAEKNYKAKFPYKECRAVHLGGVWGADGFFHICCDRRNDKLYLFNFFKNSVKDFTNYWGGEEHMKLVKSINPSRDCPRCTYNQYNKYLDDLTKTNILENLI